MNQNFNWKIFTLKRVKETGHWSIKYAQSHLNYMKILQATLAISPVFQN